MASVGAGGAGAGAGKAAAAALLDVLRAGGLPPQREALELLRRALAYLRVLPALVEAALPAGATLHVVGDLHGQWPELLTVLALCGDPVAGQNFLLFNGDFVDRGPRSVEIMLLLAALVLDHPGCVFLNRGNHETRAMNRVYGFEDEVLAKYSRQVFEAFQAVFAQLPLATLVNGSVLVMHGGVPAREGVGLADLAALPRGGAEGPRGVAHDLLWADPTDEDGLHPSPRGPGVYQFGPDVAARFCDSNGLLCCIRSHEVVMEGYAWQRGRRCLTVFSAANYVGRAGNMGAVCHIRSQTGGRLERGDLTFSTYEGATEEPAPAPTQTPRSRL